MWTSSLNLEKCYALWGTMDPVRLFWPDLRYSVSLLYTGKSTLAKVLLRMVEFDGDLLINGIDIRRYHPPDYHKHLTAVFQGFSKFNSTLRENVGLGNINKLGDRDAILEAVHLAEADLLVESLPSGLQTILDSPGFESFTYPGSPRSPSRHGLSGGEVRIRCSRSICGLIFILATSGSGSPSLVLL